jgi:sporulation protein YlmC with PRC-barrel domain
MDIPINAEVFCADGSCGRSTRVILNPVTAQVTHVVVKEATFGIERMVPLGMVKESTPTTIHLNASKSELEKLSQVTFTEYLQPEVPFNLYGVDQYIMLPYAVPGPASILLERDMVPPDEVAVRRGMRVEATDGRVGRVSEFVVSSANGYISHLVLEEGPFWSKKDVTIPIAQVDRIEKDTVYLRLDKQAIAALPMIPIHRGMQSRR